MTEQAEPTFTVVAGNPNAEELAAVAAVLARAVEEHSLDDANNEDPEPTAWQRSQRPVRRELNRGSGAWRGFSG
jgi:hypothetical protein